MSLGKEFCEANPSFYLKLVLQTESSSSWDARIVLLKHLIPEGGSLTCDAITQYAKGLVYRHHELEDEESNCEDDKIKVSMTYQDMEGDDIPIACTQELEDAISILVAQDQHSESKRGHLKLKIRIKSPEDAAGSSTGTAPWSRRTKRQREPGDDCHENEAENEDYAVYVGDTSASILAKRARGGVDAVHLQKAQPDALVSSNPACSFDSSMFGAAATMNGSYVPIYLPLPPGTHQGENSSASAAGNAAVANYYPAVTPAAAPETAAVTPPAAAPSRMTASQTLAVQPNPVASSTTRSSQRDRKPSPKARQTFVPKKTKSSGAVGGDSIGERICNALLEFHALGISVPTRIHVALLTGYSNVSSKSFANALSPLKKDGIIDYPTSKTVRLTSHGLTTLNRTVDAPQDNASMHSRLCQLMKPKARDLFYQLADGQVHTREEVAHAVGYTNLQSKGFSNALSKLSTMGMLTYPDRNSIQLSDVAFPFGRPTG